MKNIRINTEIERKFEHYWEMCVGSCHAYTALRDDYRKQLKRVHEELGFSYVRFHGLFNDDMSVCTKELSFRETSEYSYNFCNIDNIVDFLLEIGMKPFFELGDMPSCIAAEDKSFLRYHMHISPPKDILMWNELIDRFISHMLERYGKEEVERWYFEVWNEPNNAVFWSGTKEQYFEMYENTVKTLKERDPLIKVGGPATSCNMWIKEFVEYCKKRDLPIDFISTHHYPADELLWKKGDFSFEDVLKIMMSGEKRTFNKDIMYQMTKKAVEDAEGYPLIYTEWNISAQVGDSLHDESYASAMATKIIIENIGLVKGYSYWTFSDIFEECAQHSGPYHGGFGLLNYYGIPKPVYRSFQILRDIGFESYETEADNLGNVGVFVAKSKEGMKVILYNYDTPDCEVKTETIHLSIPRKFINAKIYITRIDHDHANPKAHWEKMGQPTYLSKVQIEQLENASKMEKEEIQRSGSQLTVDIPAYGVAVIDFEL